MGLRRRHSNSLLMWPPRRIRSPPGLAVQTSSGLGWRSMIAQHEQCKYMRRPIQSAYFTTTNLAHYPPTPTCPSAGVPYLPARPGLRRAAIVRRTAIKAHTLGTSGLIKCIHLRYFNPRRTVLDEQPRLPTTLSDRASGDCCRRQRPFLQRPRSDAILLCASHTAGITTVPPASSLVQSVPLSSSDLPRKDGKAPTVCARSDQDIELKFAEDLRERSVECAHPPDAETDVELVKRKFTAVHEPSSC
ncbi:hypothetical protein PUNSTDRAFT_49520 [Punctularia strigosozonata HHB-11173 SS5]|uniref:uncharacterized protein n=1 Tax=Punctularia strigosozonata (strain HHB-11173) TaxID=741275 RepID=UPI000441836C|nr:uncharacterized protein PUNSTDRAFT_49520 [Punctularia strigosozonata HHB-11173 SS5]EIN12228.1 hypothetical protein PUNSTDRAFT_49520 [Punctularia strigosozonata HHB-11173 SS5]